MISSQVLPVPDVLDEWDRALFSLINNTWQHPLLDLLMPLVTNKWNFVAPVAVVAVYVVARGGRKARWTLGGALVVLLLTDTSATALRAFLHRVRPCQALEGVRLLVGCTESFAFPSNHAANSFALASFFACQYRRLVIPLLIAASLVAYSRVYVGVHYPLDVLGGAIWGTALGFAAGNAMQALERNRAA